jgi:hypothetical protein
MDATEQVGEAEGIVDEQAETGGDEDQFFDSPEAAAEALEDDAEPEEEPVAEEADAESEDDDGVEVTLDSGDKVTLKELKEGYFRAKDYTHKTTEVANERKAVEATKSQLSEQAKVIDTVAQNLHDYLQSLIPPPPSIELARTNPGEYQYQLAIRENAIAELQQLGTMKGAVDQSRQAMSEAELRDYQAREQAALVKAMPALADPAKRASFDSLIKATAKDFGFSDEEVSQTHDNRILRLVHYARLGMKAEENRKNASRRVETPKVMKAKPAASPVNVDNKKAMHALAKSGSWRDAIKVDFE